MRKIWDAVRFFPFTLIIAGIISINVIAQEKKQEESPAKTVTNPVLVRDPSATVMQVLPARLGSAVLPIMPLGFVQKAPFSAELVSESIQTLIDGNRIIQRSSSMMYRDSEGRTRIEQTFKMPFQPVDQPGSENVEHKFINITDPATGVNYTLNTQTRTAQKFATTPQSAASTKALTLNRLVASRGNPVRGLPSNSAYLPQANSCKNESLGKQVIEGVEAEGTRMTCTIPDGAMGNERPIEYFQEYWISPELQMYVMTKSSDPRSGEATQRLTNINRDEPDASFFQPPADYTISEPQMPKDIIDRLNKLREKIREPNHQ